MHKLLLAGGLVLLSVVPSWAQITIPNSFSPGGTIYSSQVNANFTALGSDALNRTGGAITGNITVSNGVTIDGVDLSAWLDQSVKTTASPTFAAATITGAATVGSTLGVTGNLTVNTNKFSVTAASGNTTIAGTLTAGSGAVGILDSTGKIPAISSTYFASLDGTTLTGVALTGSNNTFTNRNDFKLYSETKAAPSISGGALTIDLSTGTQFAVSANANATITISNPVPSGSAGSFTILFTQDGTARTMTWPAAVKWQGGSAYTATGTNAKVDIVTCIYNNGGTTYYCAFNNNF